MDTQHLNGRFQETGLARPFEVTASTHQLQVQTLQSISSVPNQTFSNVEAPKFDAMLHQPQVPGRVPGPAEP